MKQGAIDFTGPFHFDVSAMAIAPSPHVEARETSALAAIENAQTGRTLTQNLRLIEILTKAGAKGVADPVIKRITKWERQTICLRRFDVGTWPAGRWYHPRTKRAYTRWRLATDEEKATLAESREAKRG